MTTFPPYPSAPTLNAVNGIGRTLYGRTDVDPKNNSFIATYYFIVLGIPIFPIARYRVIQQDNHYRFLGKAPLRDFDTNHRIISIVAISIALIWGILAING